MKKESIDILLERLGNKKTIDITTIEGEPETSEAGKFVWLQASEYPDKVFVLQEVIEPWRSYVKKHNLKLLRLGYYIIGKKPKRRGKWVWGQFSPFITDKDLKIIIKKAKKAGIL